MDEEMEMTERLERLRCRRDDCGTGLSYRVTRGSCTLRCIQCGGEWEQEDLSSSEEEGA
jgi:hypothetical protein